MGIILLFAQGAFFVVVVVGCFWFCWLQNISYSLVLSGTILTIMFTATLLVSLVATVQGANTPGRALFWSSKRGDSPVQYRSQSSTFNDVRNMLQDEALNRDFSVTFCSEQEDTNEFYTSPHFSASIKSSEHAVVMPNVYSSRDNHDSSLCAHARASSNAQVVSVDEMINILSSSPTSQRNFMIPLDANDANARYEQLLTQLHQSNALIIGLQSPEVVAPSTKGHYSRLLQDNEEENYNPEGTEFTIYYQNTYLYLTPDLFTGLMTALFAAFVLLTGFSCMNQIQGPSTFVHTMPTLGKEG